MSAVRRVAAGAVLPLVLVTGIAGTASAYWSSSGTGSGTASTATLNPPTALSAANIPGSGTVSLAWTGSSGLAPEGYYVTRTRLGDGVTAPACDSSPTGPLITSTTCDDTSVPAGTYNYTATAVYRSWAATGTASSAVVVTPDTTAPDVESILRAGASQAVNGGPLSWTVTFSEPVTGVSAANFSLTSAGLDGADPTIGIPTPSGDSPSASWTVSTTMAGTTGANGGSIRLDLADPTGIVDAVGNSLLPGSFTGQAYTYDTTAPAIAVTSVNGAAPTTFPFTSAATVTTFGGSCGAATGDTAEVRPRIDGAPTSPATVPCSGGFWEVTLAPALAVNGTWSLSAIQGDAAGNTGTAAPRTLTIATPAPTVTAIDRASGAPALVNAGPLTWTVTFSSPVSGVTASNFSLVTSGLDGALPSIDTVTPLSGVAPSATWTVTVPMVDTTGTDAGTIGLDFISASGIIDGSGNEPTTTSFVGQTYGFDTTEPTVLGVTSVLPDGSYRADQQVPVTVTFSEAVTVTAGTPTLSLATGTPTSTAVPYSGADLATLTFTYTVVAGNTSPDLDYGSSTALAGGQIQDAAGNTAVLTLPAPGAAGSLGATKDLVIDTTAPVVTVTDIRRLLNKAQNRIRVAGTGTDTDGPVTIHLCVATSSTPPLTSCGSGNETMVVTATVSGGTWNTGWSTTAETGTWYARATQTDTAGNVGESPVFGPVSD